MGLSKKTSKHNYRSFIWHALFLALAQNFIDVDTVIPAMLVEAGGNALHVGIMTAIMLGGSSFTQLIFAPLISNKPYKKAFLLSGINSRMLSLLALAFMLWHSNRIGPQWTLGLLFVLITLFSLGGAFANISYTDIIGKSVLADARKSFFSIKQSVTGLIVLGAAFLAKAVLQNWGYPMNYAYMFFIGFAALSIASLGFWNINEALPSKMPIGGLSNFFRVAKNELKQNPKLLHFMGFVNTLGISLSVLPFVILFAKDTLQTQASDTGLFLIFKVVGSVAAGFSVYLFSKKLGYRTIQYISVVLALSIPVIVMLAGNELWSLYLVFLIGGVLMAFYKIAMNGVLLEVSTNENRTIYAGLAGAGNIIPAIFPLLSGFLIGHFSYGLFFSVYAIIIITSLFFIYKLDCKK